MSMGGLNQPEWSPCIPGYRVSPLRNAFPHLDDCHEPEGLIPEHQVTL